MPPGEAQTGSGSGGDGEIQPRRRLCSTGAKSQQRSNRNMAGRCPLSYQLMKSTLRQTSASRALQVLQISDLPKTRHSIYSLGLMSLPGM